MFVRGLAIARFQVKPVRKSTLTTWALVLSQVLAVLISRQAVLSNFVLRYQKRCALVTCSRGWVFSVGVLGTSLRDFLESLDLLFSGSIGSSWVDRTNVSANSLFRLPVAICPCNSSFVLNKDDGYRGVLGWIYI